MTDRDRIPRRIVPSAAPSNQSPRQIEREFRALLEDGMELLPAGSAKRRPRTLLSRGYTPKYKIELFDTTFYLARVRQNQDIRFFVAYVVQEEPKRRRMRAFPRIFYKDISLIWRSASHYVRSDGENWIGKGDVKTFDDGDVEVTHSDESTTDLPLEIQTALERLVRKSDRIPTDETAIGLVLRKGHDDRIEPYRDFTDPRRRAQSNPRNLVNGGKPIAGFERADDPASLRFEPGFEPDFERGVIETSASTSRMYGGELRRFRILSCNREIQYLFFAGPRHAWIIPPQATTTELMSFGVRTIDVAVDEDLCIPGFEYHFLDESEDPPEFVSQIPEGYAGEPSEVDASRADASRWLDRLPVIVEFRRKVASRGARAVAHGASQVLGAVP